MMRSHGDAVMMNVHVLAAVLGVQLLKQLRNVAAVCGFAFRPRLGHIVRLLGGTLFRRRAIGHLRARRVHVVLACFVECHRVSFTPSPPASETAASPAFSRL